jgi:hypothetical protein
MLIQPSPEALFALDGLTRNSRWRDLDNMLEAEIAETTTRLLSSADLRTIGECQGRIKALTEFRAVARDASKTLERMGLRVPL